MPPIPERLSSLLHDVDRSFWNGDADLSLQLEALAAKLVDKPELQLADLKDEFPDAGGIVMSGVAFTVGDAEVLSFGNRGAGFAVSISVDAAAGAWLHLIYAAEGLGNLDDANVPGMKSLLKRHTDPGEGKYLVVLAFNAHIGAEVGANANFSTGVAVGLDFGAGTGYQWFHCTPAAADTKVLQAIGQAFGNARLPETTATELVARERRFAVARNEVISARRLGYVNVGIDANWGWELNGSRSYGVGAMDLASKLSVDAVAKVHMKYGLAGAFRVTVVATKQGGDDWVRVILDKNHESSFEFGFGVKVDVDLRTVGLPEDGLSLFELLVGTTTPQILRETIELARLEPEEMLTKLRERADGFTNELVTTWVGRGLDDIGPLLAPLLEKIRGIERQVEHIDDRLIGLYEKFLDEVDFDEFVALVDEVFDTAADVGPDILLQRVQAPRMKQLLELLTGELFADLFIAFDQRRDELIGEIRRPYDDFKKLVTGDAKDAIREFVEAKLEALQVNKIMEQVARFHTIEDLEREAGDAIMELVGRLYDRTWEELAAANELMTALEEVHEMATAFTATLDSIHGYVDKALNYRGKFDVSYAYQRVRREEHLIDVDLKVADGGVPEADGVALYAAAVAGNWQDVLRDAHSDRVRIHKAAFSDALRKKRTLKAHVFGWDYKSVSSLLSELDTNIKVGPAGLMTVYNLRVKGTLEEETRQRTTEMQYLLHLGGRLHGAFGTDELRGTEIDARDALGSLQSNFAYAIEDELTTLAEMADYFGIGVNLGVLDGGQVDRLMASIEALRREAGLSAEGFGKVDVKYSVSFSGDALAEALVHDFAGEVPHWTGGERHTIDAGDNRRALRALYVDRLISSYQCSRGGGPGYAVAALYRLGIDDWFAENPNRDPRGWIGRFELAVDGRQVAVDVLRQRFEWARRHYLLNTWFAEQLDDFRSNVSDGSIEAGDLERFMRGLTDKLEDIGEGEGTAQQALPFMLLDEMVKRVDPDNETARTALLEVTLYDAAGEPFHSIPVHG